MPPRDIPIQTKLMRALLLTSSTVLVLTCTAYFAYEFITYRNTMVREMSILGGILASNSTAALAFEDRSEAKEILSAVKANPHIVTTRLYDGAGDLFSQYPDSATTEDLGLSGKKEGYYFEQWHLIGIEPVIQGNRRLGTLYIRSDIGAMYQRFMLYGVIAILVIAVSLVVAYLLSKHLQKQITSPILGLAETAKSVSDQHDYSVRAAKAGNDEIGVLTDAFNHMLERIERQTDEITTFNQSLEQKVIARTEQLQIANKELEAFSYSVSHDLRAPLRSIHGYMNIFSEEYSGKLDEEGKRLIDIIISNGRRMGQLIDDLLAFSQLGRKELRKGEVSMNDMVSDIWREQREMANNREINFTLQDLPVAYADRVTIKQVWTNLISNAVKYSRNKPSPSVEIGSFEKDSRTVYFVKDNGAGFDMQYYEKLFGVFQRLHAQEDFEGTGVGLAIVERIVSKHGGKVWAEGIPDEGATFYFSLARNGLNDG